MIQSGFIYLTKYVTDHSSGIEMRETRLSLADNALAVLPSCADTLGETRGRACIQAKEVEADGIWFPFYQS